MIRSHRQGGTGKRNVFDSFPLGMTVGLTDCNML
jgi:hypothetical protein